MQAHLCIVPDALWRCCSPAYPGRSVAGRYRADRGRGRRFGRATRVASVDADRCAGCKMCLLACPSGSIHFDKVQLVSKKCDLCGGDPECAKACPTDAITYVDANWTGLDKMRQWALKTDAGAQA